MKIVPGPPAGAVPVGGFRVPFVNVGVVAELGAEPALTPSSPADQPVVPPPSVVAGPIPDFSGAIGPTAPGTGAPAPVFETGTVPESAAPVVTVPINPALDGGDGDDRPWIRLVAFVPIAALLGAATAVGRRWLSDLARR